MAFLERFAVGEPRLLARGDEELLRRVRPQLELARRRAEKGHGVLDHGALRAVYKYGPLRGSAGLRHTLRASLPGAEIPPFQEYENLSWLRRNGFHAPRPLAAGAYYSMGLPVFQFLYTEEVRPAITLRQLFEGGPDSWRLPALTELGREVARLHRERFVHRDLFPRNLLVTEGEHGPRIHFLDAWRGGRQPGLRRPSYDLACLMLFGADLFTAEEEAAFFEAYFAERERLGIPAGRERMLRSVVRQRRPLVRRARARGRARSGLPEPSRDWSPRNPTPGEGSGNPPAPAA